MFFYFLVLNLNIQENKYEQTVKRKTRNIENPSERHSGKEPRYISTLF